MGEMCPVRKSRTLSEKCVVDGLLFCLEVSSDNWGSSEVERWKKEIYFSAFLSVTANVGEKGTSQDGVWLTRCNNVCQHSPSEAAAEVFDSAWLVTNDRWTWLSAPCCLTDALLLDCFLFNRVSFLSFSSRLNQAVPPSKTIVLVCVDFLVWQSLLHHRSLSFHVVFHWRVLPMPCKIKPFWD